MEKKTIGPYLDSLDRVFDLKQPPLRWESIDAPIVLGPTPIKGGGYVKSRIKIQQFPIASKWTMEFIDKNKNPKIWNDEIAYLVRNILDLLCLKYEGFVTEIKTNLRPLCVCVYKYVLTSEEWIVEIIYFR